MLPACTATRRTLTAGPSTVSVCTCRSGVATGAAHAIAFQIWLSSSLLVDSIAVAAQALLASALSVKDSVRALQVRTLKAHVARHLLLFGPLDAIQVDCTTICKHWLSGRSAITLKGSQPLPATQMSQRRSQHRCVTVHRVWST
jgi:hypothetical protein